MERLTKYDTDGQAMMDCQKCEADWTGKHGKPMADCTALYCRNRLLDRLVKYEDTEREPEEIDMDHEAAEQLRHLCRDCDLDRLEKLAEADRAGRLAVLPCKPGDTVWAVSGKIIKCEIDEAYLCGGGGIEYIVTFDCDGSDCEGCPFSRWEQDCFGECYCECEYGCSSFKDSDIGKTVFLTREEAKKALEAMKNGN